MKAKSYLWMLLLFFPALAFAKDPFLDKGGYLDQVSASYKKAPFPKIKNKKELVGIRECANMGGGGSDTILCIIKLWYSGYRSDVELLWWKSQNKNVRKIAASLMLTEPIDGMVMLERMRGMLKSSERFSSKENRERKREIQYVISNKERIGSKLSFLIAERGQVEK